MSPNFAVRWFELDPTYQVMRLLAWVGIIDFGEHVQVARYDERRGSALSVELLNAPGRSAPVIVALRAWNSGRAAL